MHFKTFDFLIDRYYHKKWGKMFSNLHKQWYSSNVQIEDINDSILPINFKPTKDGRYLKTNDTFIQCLVVGRLTPKVKDRQAYPKGFDTRLIPDLLNIGTNKEASISLCQIVSPLSPEEEEDTTEKISRAIEILSLIQEGKDKILRRHNKSNDYAAEDLEKIQKKLYHGQTKLFHFALLVAVQGVTTAAVDKTMNSLRTTLNERKIPNELPIRGMAETYRSMMPTPYIWSKLFKRSVPVEFCANTSLLINPNPLLATFGRFIGINEKTGNPIFFNLKDKENVCGHALIIGKSGIGKSSDLLKDDIRARLDGDDVVHIAPKMDKKTNFRRVCEALEGLFIKAGFGGANFNLLHVFFDPTRMESTQDGYQTAYSNHFNMLLTSIGLLIGNGYTTQQANWLYKALTQLYYEFHVIDDGGKVINTDRWADGEFWPDLMDLKEIFDRWIHDGKHKLDLPAIQALDNNTAMIHPQGPLGYLINKNSLDLSNPFIVVDLSSLSKTPNVQQAITLAIMSIINTKLECVKEGAEEKKCLITLDEGADLLKNEFMTDEIEDLYRKGRSFGVYVKIVAQDLTAFNRKILDMIKANTDYVLLFGGYRPDNIDSVIKEFNLTDDDIDRLLQPGWGRGVIIIGAYHIWYFNDMDDFEKNVIYGKDPLDFKAEETNEQEAGTSLQFCPSVEWVVKECKAFPKEWIVNMTSYPNGWEKETETNPMTGKRTVVFYKKELKNEEGKIKQQLPKHYFSVTMLGGELSKEGAYVTFDDWGTDQVADVVAVFTFPDGSKYTVAFEYETPECKHSIEDLRKKRGRLESKKEGERACFDDVMFVGQNTHIPFLIQALGDDYVLQRGEQVANYVAKVKNMKITNLDVFTSPLTEQSAEVA